MKLSEPITIRSVEFKNRVIMPAMGTFAMLFGADGPTETIIDFYSRRAEGGAGAIIIGGIPPSAFIPEEDLKQPMDPRIRMKALERMAQRIHEKGARLGVQLFHSSQFPSGEIRSPFPQEGVAPSHRVEPQIPPLNQEQRELTVEEIEAIIRRFALAASRVKESGADFLEFHLAHGHAQLSYQFFTPLENRRTDHYGNGFAGRMKFGLECIKAIREAVGEDYPVFVRLGANDEAPEGVKPEDAAAYAAELEKATVDCISVSVGMCHSFEHIDHVAPLKKKSAMGTYAHMAETVKKRVGIPVVAVGRINTPEVAEDILGKSQADMIAICRQLICDPLWVNKVMENKAEEIVACNSCNTFCCFRGSQDQPPTHCCIKTKKPEEELALFFPRA